MGSWGHAVFEDDSSLDWAGDFAKAPSLSALERALDLASGKRGSLDDWLSAGVLVSCEILASLRGKPSDQLPDDLKAWVDALSRPKATAMKSLVAKARAALSRVRDSSEVQESWEDSGDLDRWHASLEDLDLRVQGRRPKKRVQTTRDDFWAKGDEDNTPPIGTTFVMPIGEGVKPDLFGAVRVLRPAIEKDLRADLDYKHITRAKRAEYAKRYVVVAITSWFGKDRLKNTANQLLREILRPAYAPTTLAILILEGSPSSEFSNVGKIKPSPAEMKLTGHLHAGTFGWAPAELLARIHLRQAKKGETPSRRKTRS